MSKRGEIIYGRTSIDIKILSDEHIRRLLLANKAILKQFDRDRGNTNSMAFDLYIRHSYANYQQTGNKHRYITSHRIVEYLNYLGYTIDFILTPIDAPK